MEYETNDEIVDISDRTDITSLKADAATYIHASGCTALTELKADAAAYIDANGCTALTELKADAADSIYVTGCTALTELKADSADMICVTGCTALTELKADAATGIYAYGCTALKGMIPGGRDSRGFFFFGFRQKGEWRIFAGCHNFSIPQAKTHWGPGGKSDRPDCLALVETIVKGIAEFEENNA